MKTFILKTPFTKNGRDYSVCLHANEYGHVIASVYGKTESSELGHGVPLIKEVELCDLFGRKTRLPVSVMIASRAPFASEHQKKMLGSFKRICLNRLQRSIGCLSL